MALPDPTWSGSEEDHVHRSHVIQWLLHQTTSGLSRSAATQHSIPRVVIQYWHDLDALPDDVAECMRSWKQLENHRFELHLFDDVRARRFIAANYGASHVAAFDRCYHPAMRCDYFRLCYMVGRGGFYVDADEVYQGTGCEELVQDGRLKLQPLCYDTSTHQMVDPADFLGDTSFPSGRIFYVNNNPIVAPPGHPLLRLALQRSTDILLRSGGSLEIQSTTGPGNLSACLVRHVAGLQQAGAAWDFVILRDWQSLSECRWFLSYRDDDRNWRRLKVPSGGKGSSDP